MTFATTVFHCPAHYAVDSQVVDSQVVDNQVVDSQVVDSQEERTKM